MPGTGSSSKTFGAVMAAAQSSRLPEGKDTRNAVVLHFSGFDVACASAGRSLDNLPSRSEATREAYDCEILKGVKLAVWNTLVQVDLTRWEADSDGRRVVVVLDDMGCQRDVLRALCTMHASSGGTRRAVELMSDEVRKKFLCGPVYFVAVGTGCDTALLQAGLHPEFYSAIVATPDSGREVFRCIVDGQANAEAIPTTRDGIRRFAGSICPLEEGIRDDTAPTSHAWSAIGHALVGNARLAAASPEFSKVDRIQQHAMMKTTTYEMEARSAAYARLLVHPVDHGLSRLSYVVSLIAICPEK
jgi:hypothetical protein